MKLQLNWFLVCSTSMLFHGAVILKWLTIDGLTCCVVSILLLCASLVLIRRKTEKALSSGITLLLALVVSVPEDLPDWLRWNVVMLLVISWIVLVGMASRYCRFELCNESTSPDLNRESKMLLEIVFSVGLSLSCIEVVSWLK